MCNGSISKIARFPKRFVGMALAWFCLLSVTQPHADIVSYNYDDLGRLIQETYEDGTQITYTYDEAGNRLSKQVQGAGTGITVTSPDGGESWEAGSSRTIHWTYRGDPGTEVNLELLKGGVTHSVITSSTPIGSRATGSYAWTIPRDQAPGNDYQVKVTSATNPQHSDTSNSRFTVTAAVTGITVTGPDGGERLQVGTAKTIQWTYHGNAGPTVRIELLKGGALNKTVDTGIPVGVGGTGSYNWIVPLSQTAGEDYRIKVTSEVNGAFSDTSNADFAITPGIAVTSPNGGESWGAGSAQTISWKYMGNPGDSLKIELLKAGALNSTISAGTPIGNDGSGSYTWAIPADQPPASDYRIRVASASDSQCTDTSDNNFTVIPVSITVASPNRGQSWTVGTTLNIQWSYSGNEGDLVRIELLKGGVVDSTIAAGTPIGTWGSGTYAWVIPLNQAPGSDYRIRVTSTSNSACTDTSDNDFTIIPVSVTVSSPNGGESWTPGTTRNISWNYSGDPGDSVKIELLKGGVASSTLVASAPIGAGGGGSYAWPIPSNQVLGNDYRIRVTSTTNSVYTDTSDNDFAVAPIGIAVSSPNGGQGWSVGTNQTISWAYYGNPGASVKIELLKGGEVNRIISANTSPGSGGIGSFSWVIPANQAPGDDYRIRVTSTGNGAYTDTSHNNFSIVLPSITVSFPNGGEALKAGTSQTIRWTTTGDPGPFVRIELLKGEALKGVIVQRTPTGTSGAGSYVWRIPPSQVPGADYRIRVTSATENVYTDASNNNFTIQP